MPNFCVHCLCTMSTEFTCSVLPLPVLAEKQLGTKKGKDSWEMTWRNRKVDGIFISSQPCFWMFISEESPDKYLCIQWKDKIPKHLWSRIGNLICGDERPWEVIALCVKCFALWSLRIFTWTLKKLVLHLHLILFDYCCWYAGCKCFAQWIAWADRGVFLQLLQSMLICAKHQNAMLWLWQSFS